LDMDVSKSRQRHQWLSDHGQSRATNYKDFFKVSRRAT
jgi:hypothetical protein